MSTRIGHVEKIAGQYRESGGMGWTEDLQKARVDSYSHFVPVRVTEEPGPPTREVVELRGTVDLDGLKFAIQSTAKDRTFYTGDDFYLSPDDAKVFQALEDAGITIAIDSLACVRIVGIREVPGPTVRRVEEITVEMLK